MKIFISGLFIVLRSFTSFHSSDGFLATPQARNFNVVRHNLCKTGPCISKFQITGTKFRLSCKPITRTAEPSRDMEISSTSYSELDGIDLSGKTTKIRLSNETISRLQSKFGITRLAPVQTATISAIMGGNDVLIRSHTGSGKTLAFCLPLVEILRLVAAKKKSSSISANQPANPRILILLPTRELALQVARVLRTLAGSAFRCVAAVGGTALNPQVCNSKAVPGYLSQSHKERHEIL